MKTIFTLSIVSALITSMNVSFADRGCQAATQECIQSVLPSVSYNAAKAARACAGGVSVDCINAVLPSTSYNAVEAAAACKGGVTVDCINAVLPSVGYNAKKAANACAGREDR